MILYKRKGKVMKECLKIVRLFFLAFFTYMIHHCIVCKFVTLTAQISTNEMLIVVCS